MYNSIARQKRGKSGKSFACEAEMFNMWVLFAHRLTSHKTDCRSMNAQPVVLSLHDFLMSKKSSTHSVRTIEIVAWSVISLCAVVAMGWLVHGLVPEATGMLLVTVIGGAAVVGFFFGRLIGRAGSGSANLETYQKLVEENVRRRTTELSLVNEDLKGELEQYPEIRKQLEQRLAHLVFLYRLSKVVEPEHWNLTAVFSQTAGMLREVYQNPESTCVRITFDGIPYETEGFERTEVGQFALLNTAQGKTGRIDVFLRESDDESDGKGAFTAEERELLDAVAERLERIAELSQVTRRLTFFRGLIDGSHDSAFVIEPKWGRLVDVNRTACESLGYAREELLDRTIGEVDESLSGDTAWKRWCADLKSAGQSVSEGVHCCKDGRSFSVETSFRWVKEGEEDFIIALSRDITERKQAELKRAELIEQLRRTNERVESINCELKDFAHVISHDLKAPLIGIKSMAEWLQSDYSDKLDADGADQLDQLVQMTKRMERLIAGVLEYSRAGRVKEAGVKVDLNETAIDAIEMVSAPEHIDISVEGKLPVVECVETRIHQVLQNLISNAVKYNDKPNGVIRIHCEEDGDFWKFCVEDNGPGIEERDRERIFKIFQTLAPKDSFESTGVGLAVVKRIVELYGGRIWVESEVGTGSRFYFTLPRDTEESVESEVEVAVVCE